MLSSYLASWVCADSRIAQQFLEIAGKPITTCAIDAVPHASWLNQIELYSTILQRQFFAPNDVESLTEAGERLVRFAQPHHAHPHPFNWQLDLKYHTGQLYRASHQCQPARYKRLAALEVTKDRVLTTSGNR